MTIRFAILAISAILAGPAIAQDGNGQPAGKPTPPTTAAASADKPICRREVATGSIMPGKRVCHTKAEWAAISSASSAEADRALSLRSNAEPIRQ